MSGVWTAKKTVILTKFYLVPLLQDSQTFFSTWTDLISVSIQTDQWINATKKEMTSIKKVGCF